MQARNEELARRTAAISEQDFESMRSEFQARLETAERKVYALTKERDALRRGTDKLSSANDLLKEKDSIIQQVPPLCAGLLLLLHDFLGCKAVCLECRLLISAVPHCMASISGSMLQ